MRDTTREQADALCLLRLPQLGFQPPALFLDAAPLPNFLFEMPLLFVVLNARRCGFHNDKTQSDEQYAADGNVDHPHGEIKGSLPVSEDREISKHLQIGQQAYHRTKND